MQLQQIKIGDKLTFQWLPGYRGPLRDGEIVVVLALLDEGVQVRYRLNQTETIRSEHLFR